MPAFLRRLLAWFFVDWPIVDFQTDALRFHSLVVGLLSLPVYLAFALTHLWGTGALRMAAVCGASVVITVISLLVLRFSRSNSLPGQFVTLALTVQVFGEMAVNGGLQAPSAALSLLIVPSAIFTAGTSAIPLWTVVTIVLMASISVLDINSMLPANELSLAAQQYDRVFSLSAGISIMAVLVYVFQRQVSQALDNLTRERANFRHRSLHDTLTGIPNRRYFYEHAGSILSKEHKGSVQPVLFYIDIDRFKFINDQYGHLAGDALLKAFTTRLQKQSSETDFAARLAGDEFALLALLPVESIAARVEQLLGLTDEPIVLDGAEHRVTISLGHAVYKEDGHDLDTLMRIADERMYQHKSDQKNAQIDLSSTNVVRIAP